MHGILCSNVPSFPSPRRWKSRSDVPELVDKYLGGELPIDHYVTHTFDGVDKV